MHECEERRRRLTAATYILARTVFLVIQDSDKGMVHFSRAFLCPFVSRNNNNNKKKGCQKFDPGPLKKNVTAKVLIWLTPLPFLPLLSVVVVFYEGDEMRMAGSQTCHFFY
jgi:hypothetical protein